MDTKPTQSDAAIDTALAALRAASPPEGMNARIANRLRQHAIAQAASTVPNTPRTSAQAAAWWRGAATGAATALFAMGLLLVASHLTSSHRRHLQTASVTQPSPHPSPAQSAGGKLSTPVEWSNRPCLREMYRRLADAPQAPATTRIDARVIAQNTGTESSAPSQPAPDLPLTPQERQLAHLARTADPQQLAALGRDEEARLDAEKSSEFATPSAHPDTAQSAETALGNPSQPAANRVSSPASESAPDPSANSSPVAVPETTPAVNPAEPPPSPKVEAIDPKPSPSQEEQK
jgi:hypothetical protein